MSNQQEQKIISLVPTDIIEEKKKIVIPRHSYTRPKKGKILENQYEILNPNHFAKWAELNQNNPFIVEQMTHHRLDLLVARENWHQREFHAACSIGAYHNPQKDGADAHFLNGILVEPTVIETIIPPSKKLSIVFARCPRRAIELRSNDISLCATR